MITTFKIKDPAKLLYAVMSRHFRPLINQFEHPVIIKNEPFQVRGSNAVKKITISYDFIDVFTVGWFQWVMSIGDFTTLDGQKGKTIMLAKGQKGVNYLKNSYFIERLFVDGMGLYHVNSLEFEGDIYLPIDPKPGEDKIIFKKREWSESHIYDYAEEVKEKVYMHDLETPS